MSFSSSWWSWALLLTVLLYLLYIYGTRSFHYFSKRNVPFIKPVIFFGNMAKTILGNKHPMVNINEVYDKFPNSRYVGFFELTTPVYVLRDPELIKRITVKDYDHFLDHHTLFDDAEPILSESLFNLKGQKWRDMRSLITPAFTSSKMKLMYDLFNNSAQDMVKHLENESKAEDKSALDISDLFSRYTNDVISSYVFGIQLDSHRQPNNKFYKMTKNINRIGTFNASLHFFGLSYLPKIVRFLILQAFDSVCLKYLKETLLGTMEIREKENIVRPDMINLLIEARKGTPAQGTTDCQNVDFTANEKPALGKHSHKRVWTDNEIAAQAIMLIFAGLDTSSTLLSFLAHELAVTSDIQKKLLEEIDEFLQDDIPSYESIQELKYLDMVIAETFRKWPPGTILDRECTKPYVFQSADGKAEAMIEPGISIKIPVYAIHHDPKYYPDPDKFDPERFSEENKKNLNPFAYFPFGVGRRNCIGSRFALIIIKVVMFHLLRKFTFEVCSKTTPEIVLAKTPPFTIRPEKGFWLELKPRADVRQV